MLSISGEPVVVGVTMYILSISSVSEVMMVRDFCFMPNLHCVQLSLTSFCLNLRQLNRLFDVLTMI